MSRYTFPLCAFCNSIVRIEEITYNLYPLNQANKRQKYIITYHCKYCDSNENWNSMGFTKSSYQIILNSVDKLSAFDPDNYTGFIRDVLIELQNSIRANPLIEFLK